MDRNASISLLKRYIDSENLRHHCRMVAEAMDAYADELDKSSEEKDLWWAAGLLHDLDWEKYPDEHPNKAVQEILPDEGYPEPLLNAVLAHAPERTGRQPQTEMERYLFACDELSGFMHAVSLVRPNGFDDMKVKSVTKKLKDASFASNIPRDHIRNGADRIGKPLNEHIAFLINVFKNLN